MIKGAIFDLDGTLLDSMYIWRNLGEIYLKSLGYEPKENAKELYRTYTYRRATEFFRDEYGLEVTQERFMSDVRVILQKYYEEEAPLKPGVDVFLRRMREIGVSMCIATATDERMVRPALRRLGIEDYFSTVLTCSVVGKGKTDPLIYRMALEHLGTEKSRTPVFEDALYAAKTVKADGFVMVGVRDENEDGLNEVKAISNIYIADYRDLREYWKAVEAL